MILLFTYFVKIIRIVIIQITSLIQLIFSIGGKDLARTRIPTTKYEIIQVASKFFFEKGYSSVSGKIKPAGNGK